MHNISKSTCRNGKGRQQHLAKKHKADATTVVKQYLLAVTQALESCAWASCAFLIADMPWDGEAPPCGEHQVTHRHKAGAGLLG